MLKKEYEEKNKRKIEQFRLFGLIEMQRGITGHKKLGKMH